MGNDSDMRTLPIEGLVLAEFVVAGNGKDAEVHAIVNDGRRFVFGSSGSRLRIVAHGAVLTEITGPDDATLKVRYTASRLVLSEARVHYPGTFVEWTKDVEALNRGRSMSWAIQEGSFRLLGEESPDPSGPPSTQLSKVPMETLHDAPGEEACRLRAVPSARSARAS